MRNICVLTGSRAEYGLLKPIMKAVEKSEKLRLSIIVTGMHLSRKHGYSLKEIERDGFKVSKKVKMHFSGGDSYCMTKSIGKGVKSIAKALRDISPDVLLVLGDRTEALAAGIAAVYMNIPLAHVSGGDISKGGVDESVRHVLTKFAHIHFPSTKKSAQRIIKMGEEESRVFAVGAPCLDTILHYNFLSKEEIFKKYSLNPQEPLILVVQHSVTTEPGKAGFQMKETMEAIKSLGFQTIIIHPNSDAGGKEIIKQIEVYEQLPFIKSFRNLPHLEYLGLMKHAGVMVGNSSSGIVESSSFKLPVVNIGIRQDKRERANNVIDVPHCTDKIQSAVEYALSPAFRERVENCVNPYGDGNTATKIVNVLSNIGIKDGFLQKQITY